MKWNWQKNGWPSFSFNKLELQEYEQSFLKKAGIFLGTIKHLDNEDNEHFRVDLLCQEAYKTSEIEGEILNRESLQSSIRKNFGLKTEVRKNSLKENGISKAMVDLYLNFAKPLTKQNLLQWNALILYGRDDLNLSYRTDTEAMEIVSGSLSNPKVHFVAPPSNQVERMMAEFVKWFNSSQSNTYSPLARAGIAHLYFVCIHPFDDGNGRIARALAQKSLSQNLESANLIALSQVIEKNKKQYYKALDEANKNLEITGWLKYFALTILEAQDYSQTLIEFIVKKNLFYRKHLNKLNSRQEKVIARVFKEGLKGFEGGLSTENYISITGTSRATATRDLQDLLDKGILHKTGLLKSTRYFVVMH